jgi:hypothetical protein
MRLLSGVQVENIRLQVGMLGDSDFTKITVAASVAHPVLCGLGTIKVFCAKEPTSLVIIDYAQPLSAPQRKSVIWPPSARSKGAGPTQCRCLQRHFVMLRKTNQDSQPFSRRQGSLTCAKAFTNRTPIFLFYRERGTD